MAPQFYYMLNDRITQRLCSCYKFILCINPEAIPSSHSCACYLTKLQSVHDGPQRSWYIKCCYPIMLETFNF